MRSPRPLLLLALTSALAACGGGNSNFDGGFDAGGDTHADAMDAMDARADGAGRDASADGVAWPDAGADASPSTVECSRVAAVYCAQLAACAPDEFARRFEPQGQSHCEGETQRACEQLAALPGVAGIADPGACEQALTASCDEFFAATTMPPPACARAPGRAASGEPCGVTDQCQAGLQCYGATPGCQDGVCATPAGEGELCTSEVECDTRAGLHCVSALDPDAGTAGEPRCQAVTYGGDGAQCREHSTLQCAAGLVCTPGGRCTPFLLAGAACDPALDFCDVRRGLSCRASPDGGAACAPAPFAHLGDACDAEAGVAGGCARYLYCDGTTQPAACLERAGLGEPCSGALENCAPGLTCRSGICRYLDPATCP